MGKFAENAQRDGRGSVIARALLSENSTPVLLTELIGDASASELHELSKGARSAGVTGRRAPE
jgi:hypothetical protein